MTPEDAAQLALLLRSDAALEAWRTALTGDTRAAGPPGAGAVQAVPLARIPGQLCTLTATLARLREEIR